MEVIYRLNCLWIVLIIFIFSGCNNQSSDASSDRSVSSLVNIPVGPDQIIDTANAARLEFEQTLIDWDTIRQGQNFDATFRFVNQGNRPALISEVRTSCGCTATDYSSDPIPPGGRSEIKVTFNSFGREGYQKKSINVIGNTFPPRTLLYLQGFVEK